MLDRIRRFLTATLTRRPLLPFLLAATLTLHLVLAVRTAGRQAAIGVLFAEFGLLGVWAGGLRCGWRRRLAMAAAAGLGLCCLSASMGRSPPFAELMSVLFAYAAGVGVVTALSRLAGRMLWHRGTLSPTGPTQFSIWGILSTTTGVALLFTLVRFMDFPGGDPVEMVLGCGALGLLPVTVAEIVRRVRPWLVAMGATLLASLACWGMFAAAVLPRSQREEWLVIVLLHGLFYAVWMLGVRCRLQPAGGKALAAAADEPPPAASSDATSLTGPASMDLEA